jgi:hypothetical protein
VDPPKARSICRIWAAAFRYLTASNGWRAIIRTQFKETHRLKVRRCQLVGEHLLDRVRRGHAIIVFLVWRPGCF